MKLKQVIQLLWHKLQLSRQKLLQLIPWVLVRQFLMFKLLNQLRLELLQRLQHLQYPSWVVEQLALQVMIRLSLPKQFPTILFLLPLLLLKLLLQVLQQQQPLQLLHHPKVCPLPPLEMEVLHTELSIPVVQLSLQMFKLLSLVDPKVNKPKPSQNLDSKKEKDNSNQSRKQNQSCKLRKNSTKTWDLNKEVQVTEVLSSLCLLWSWDWF